MVEKIGPYRVYERLGVGGMGEVYKAYDDRLDRWVAIKRIRPDREDAEDNRERFKREARATARLNHPAIVHLYGIFQDGDSDCIVMEYVDGKTLDQILAEEGPLDPLRVASLGHEIASGLGEAHANGILHRDLKAENIMITPRGRAKILDFGLAKPILRSELDPVLTGKGQLVGTSRAMSPEYVSGETVDHRSDLFSLGVLLYECLTGHSPFKAHNTLATLKQVMLHKQTPVRQVNTRVPAELSDLIDRLLEKDPKDRPQSAHEISLAFGRLTGQLSSGVMDIPAGLGSGNVGKASSTLTSLSASDTVLDLRARRRWIPVLVGLVLLIVGAFGLGMWIDFEPDGPQLSEDERIQIILADIDNSTDDQSLGPPLQEALRTVLAQSRFNTVLSRGQLREALSRMQKPKDTHIDREIALEIAQREGAERVIAASLSIFGTSYSLVVDVVDPTTDQGEFPRKATAKTPDDLLVEIDQIGKEIRRHLGESADEIAATAKPLASVTTPNLEALRIYTAGLEEAAAERDEDAIAFFDRAIALDKGFAMAQAKAGVAYSNMGRNEEALLRFESAMENQDRLTEVQKFYVRGWLARWQGTAREGQEIWKQMVTLYPENSDAVFNLGMSYWIYDNNFTAAANEFRRNVSMLELDGRSELGWCLMALGEPEAALENFEASTTGNDRFWGRAALMAARREYAESLRIISNPDLGTVQSLRFQSTLLADQGQLDSAESRLLEALELAKAAKDLDDESSVLQYLVTLAFLQGDHDEMSTRTSLLLEKIEDRGLLSAGRFEVEPVPTLAFIGKLAARSGNDDLATRIMQLLDGRIDASSPRVWNIFAQIFTAERAAAAGNHAGAVEILDPLIEETGSYEARESRANAHLLAGSLELAKADLAWLAENRNMAFAECSSSFCDSRLHSVVASNRALLQLAQVLEQQGRTAEAAEAMALFESRGWGNPQDEGE